MISALRLTELGRVASLTPSPDGEWLAVAVARLDDDDAAYVHDLWRVPTDGGAPTQLTAGPWNDRAPRFRHDGDLLFLSNRPIGKRPSEGEDKRSQIWALPGRGGEAQRVTDEPLGVAAYDTAGNVIAAIAPLFRDVAFEDQREHAETIAKHGPSLLRYRRGPVRYWDHWMPAAAPRLIAYAADGGDRRDLWPDVGDALRADPELSLSPDGSEVAASCAGTPDDRLHRVWIRRVDTRDGALREEVGAEISAFHRAFRYSPSGDRLAFARTRYFEERVHDTELVMREGGEDRVVGADWDRWLIPEAFLDERRLVVSLDDQGETRLAVIDVESSEVERLDAPGTHGGVTARGEAYVGIAHTLHQPPRPFMVEGGERRWLAELSGVGASELEGLRVERMGVEASDGQTIDTRLVLPPTPGPHPLLFWIHGGPVSYMGDSWHWRWNAAVMAASGFAVALPNARGSTGYGYDFVDGIWGNQWGAQCYDDLMSVVDALATHDAIDADRMIAMGGSFGGYMSNWIGGQTDRFAAIITHASLYDLRAFYGTTDLPAYFGKHNASTPWAGEIDRYSPHRFMPRWKTPTLVIHGDKDYRVPVTEALALFEGLQAHGVDSELVVFPDENHWIVKPRNIRAWYDAVVDFARRKLDEA